MAEFKLIGELPRGDWQFCLVRIEDEADAVLVVDVMGLNNPRMVIDGKLVEIR